MKCTKTRYDREILCAGAMTDYMTIKSSTAGTTDFGDVQAEPTLATIRSYFGYLETVRPSIRFDGVSIDRTSTHYWYIPYEQDIYELDVNSLFVTKEGTKERIFKLNEIENYDEQDRWLALHLEAKGFSENTATEA
jgi:hypothetical protein